MFLGPNIRKFVQLGEQFSFPMYDKVDLDTWETDRLKSHWRLCRKRVEKLNRDWVALGGDLDGVESLGEELPESSSEDSMEEGVGGEVEQAKKKLIREKKKLREQELQIIKDSSPVAFFNRKRKRVSSRGGIQLQARIEVEAKLAEDIVRMNQQGEKPWEPQAIQREFIERMAEAGCSEYYGCKHGVGHKHTDKWLRTFRARHNMKRTTNIHLSSVRSEAQLREEIYLTWGRWLRYLELVEMKINEIERHTGQRPLLIRCNMDETFLRSHAQARAVIIPKKDARRVSRDWNGARKTTKEGVTGVFFVTDTPLLQLKPTIIFKKQNPNMATKIEVEAVWGGDAYIEKHGNSKGTHMVDSSMMRKIVKRVIEEKKAREQTLQRTILLLWILDDLGAHRLDDTLREEELEDKQHILTFVLQPETGSKLQPLDTQGILSSIKLGQSQEQEEYYSLINPLFKEYTMKKLAYFSKDATFDKLGFVLRPDAFAPLQSELEKFLSRRE
ncbi:unnamed protein product [Amoebophrya sp. A25]|nr:unnamed protein product [Amoebophrya sp. A25]|eukprot:GSA25T00027071001.1